MSRSQPQFPKRSTIKDVAQMAGVSITTVSNVLNDRRAAMSEETLQRVQAAIRQLNYRPSRVARSLVTSQTATIGVIVNEISTPLFLHALNYIEPIARQAGHSVLLCTALSLEDEQQALNLLLEKAVDGIIFLSTSFVLEQDYLADLSPAAPPLILINRITPCTGFDQIFFDNLQGVVAAVDYLVRLGHRHIAHLHGEISRRSFADRLLGYQTALARHRLEYKAAYVRLAGYEAPPGTWAQATQTLLALSPRPTAIIAANDVIAATVLRTVQRAGVLVPEEMSIIGFDDQHFCTYLNPALTTVQVPIVEAGQRAVQMLLARITGQQTAAEQITLPCPLIVRESTGPACA
ncbi:MAG: LacI family DNA-binding transcriptional regulator [Chloroflexota bacterium]